MKEVVKQFLDLLFENGEEICISPSKYAFASVPKESLSSDMSLVSQSVNRDIFYISEDDINLVSINPIKGDRLDSNVTAYRSFLVELDDGDLVEQMKYVESMEMPYSVCVFSGNKSLHFGIVLEEDLPSEDLWRDINEWILNIMSRADQATKNPSRSIRFPENKRHDGKMLVQSLVEIKNRISYGILLQWLNQYKELNPRDIRAKEQARMMREVESDYDIDDLSIPMWMEEKLLENGVTSERNVTWWKFSYALACKGMNSDDIEALLSKYFIPESDFTTTEWRNSIKQGAKYGSKGKYVN